MASFSSWQTTSVCKNNPTEHADFCFSRWFIWYLLFLTATLFHFCWDILLLTLELPDGKGVTNWAVCYCCCPGTAMVANYAMCFRLSEKGSFCLESIYNSMLLTFVPNSWMVECSVNLFPCQFSWNTVSWFSFPQWQVWRSWHICCETLGTYRFIVVICIKNPWHKFSFIFVMRMWLFGPSSLVLILNLRRQHFSLESSK